MTKHFVHGFQLVIYPLSNTRLNSKSAHGAFSRRSLVIRRSIRSRGCFFGGGGERVVGLLFLFFFLFVLRGRHCL